MHSTPKRIAEIYRLSDERRDIELWRMGIYVHSAVATVIDSVLAGKKSKAEYIKKPILIESCPEEEYKESKEEIAVFEMKQRIKILEKQGLPLSPI